MDEMREDLMTYLELTSNEQRAIAEISEKTLLLVSEEIASFCDGNTVRVLRRKLKPLPQEIQPYIMTILAFRNLKPLTAFWLGLKQGALSNGAIYRYLREVVAFMARRVPALEIVLSSIVKRFDRVIDNPMLIAEGELDAALSEIVEFYKAQKKDTVVKKASLVIISACEELPWKAAQDATSWAVTVSPYLKSNEADMLSSLAKRLSVACADELALREDLAELKRWV